LRVGPLMRENPRAMPVSVKNISSGDRTAGVFICGIGARIDARACCCAFADIQEARDGGLPQIAT
jgi:hypothetical protein